MVSALDSGSGGLDSSPGRGTALCSWARYFTLIVPLSTQVYKWVPANLLLGVTLRQRAAKLRHASGKAPDFSPPFVSLADHCSQITHACDPKVSLLAGYSRFSVQSHDLTMRHKNLTINRVTSCRIQFPCIISFLAC